MTQPNSLKPLQGRVAFAMRYQTLGTNNLARKLLAAIMVAGVIEKDSPETNHAANFALLVAHTESITTNGTHPEIDALRRFWAWWLEHKADPVIDGAALWDWRLNDLGTFTMIAWNDAWTNSQVTALDAPRALLPDEKLTDEERADPNS
jgi:hypothetical protein